MERDATEGAGREPAEDVTTELKEAAARIKKNAGIHALPLPPASALKGVSWESPGPAVRAAAPHWNEAVRTLRRGDSGYATLVRMEERLRRHTDEADRRVEDLDRVAEPYRLIVWAFAEGAAACGGSDRISAALARGPLAPLEGWFWCRTEGGALVLESDTRGGDPLRGVYEETLQIRTLSPYDTWDGALERAMNAFWPHEERLVAAKRQADLPRFRLSVIEQVLREHEVAGYVDFIDPEKYGEPTDADVEAPLPRPAARESPSGLSHKELLVVVLAHEIISTDPEGKLSRSAVLGGRKGTIGGVDGRVLALKEQRPEDFGSVSWHGGSTGGTALELAAGENIYAFRTLREVRPMAKASRNRKPKGGERRVLEALFRKRIETLYEEVSAAGIQTADDVIPYIREKR